MSQPNANELQLRHGCTLSRNQRHSPTPHAGVPGTTINEAVHLKFHSNARESPLRKTVSAGMMFLAKNKELPMQDTLPHRTTEIQYGPI